MKTKNWLKKNYPWLILAAVLSGLVFLNVRYLDHWLDSDMSAEMMFSRLLARQGHLFASGSWFYSTEFRVLYTQLIMVPLFHISSNWHLIRAVTNVVFYLLLLLSYFYLSKALKTDWKKTILCGAVLLLPFSETMMLHMQMGNTYMSHVILLYFYFGMFLRIGKKEKEQERGYLLWFIYMLLSFVFGISGVRYLLAMQVPLMLSALIFWIKGETFQNFRSHPDILNWKTILSGQPWHYFVISIFGFIPALLGYAFNALWITQHYTFQTYDGIKFISVYQGLFNERVRDTFGALLMLFGYIPDKSVLSLRGIVTMSAFILIILLIVCTIRCRTTKEESNRFLLLFFMTAFLLNTFVFVFTDSTIVPRYYITSLIFLVPLMAVFFSEEKNILDRRSFACIMVVCLCLSTLKVTASFAMTDKNADRYGAISYLTDHGYQFGYATYWNGNITQELSNGKLETANIKDPESFTFFKWSSEADYYLSDYPKGKVFILLSEQEEKDGKKTAVLKYAEKVYEDGKYAVYSYQSNEVLLSHVEKNG